MQEHLDASNSPNLDSAKGAVTGPQMAGLHWLKRFLACNPFYLVSAALLLYGFYLVSADATFLEREISQLIFNFMSLQVYEVLLVVTALFLVRRRIWYDSTLLVGVEHLLILVPFILISQAALIEIQWVWEMCLVAGLAVVVRTGALKQFFTELNLPNSVLRFGVFVLMMNVALPVTYRILHEHKVGKLPTTGAAYFTNEFAWLLLLPALCALANFVPAKAQKKELLPQRFWIPPSLFLLWFIGTAIHLYCLGYVYDFPLRHELVAPAIWVLFWTLSNRLKELVPELSATWERTVLVLPLVSTLVGIAGAGNEVFLFLSILNVAIYAGICIKDGDRFARHLVLISGLALVAGLPEHWGRSLFSEFSHEKCVGASAALYFVFRAALSLNPKLGLFGALVIPLAVISLFGTPTALHWGVQGGFAFLLLHSLRWTDNQHEGTGAVRLLAGVGWVAHTFWWMHDGGAAWMTCPIAGSVLAISWLATWFRGKRGSLLVPISASLVMLSGPGDSAAGTLQSTPVGLLAVLGSFLLFAIGTGAALTKHRWLH